MFDILLVLNHKEGGWGLACRILTKSYRSFVIVCSCLRSIGKYEA